MKSDPEVLAMKRILTALGGLSREARLRVVGWLHSRESGEAQYSDDPDDHPGQTVIAATGE